MSQNNDLHDPFVLLQRVHRWRMAFFGIVILLAGSIIGASTMFIWQRHKLVRQQTHGVPPGTNPTTKPTSTNLDPPYMQLATNLDARLKLTPAQEQKLLPILRQHMTQLNRIKMEARPKIREQLTEMNEEVIALLTDQQKAKWRQDFKRLQQQFQLDYRPRVPETQAKKTADGKKPDNATGKSSASQKQKNNPAQSNNPDTLKNTSPRKNVNPEEKPAENQ